MAMNSPVDIAHTLQEQPHAFLQPSPFLHTSFLALAKTYLDPLASTVTESQDERQRQERQNRKRKRRPNDVGRQTQDLLRMKQVHVSGFDVDQVWQQAKRVLNAAADEAERDLLEGEDDQGQEQELGGDSRGKKVHFAGDDESEFDDSNDESLGEEGVDWEYEKDDVSVDGGVGLNPTRGNAEDYHSDAGSLDIGEETPPSEVSDEERGESFTKDKHGLNDGFFSIDEFNKKSQFLEQVDARGGSDDGAASDEEDIDWTVDPLSSNFQAQTSKRSQRNPPNADPNDVQDEEDEDSEDDDDGPTFGNMDLNAPEGDSDLDGEFDDEDAMDDGGFSNTNDITYNDFFAPPARQASKKQKLHKARLKVLEKEVEDRNLAAEPGLGDGEDAALERTISSVHRDLFEDELSDDPDQGGANQDSKNSKLSSHERRQLALREQIRRLEAANVAAKPWALTGETFAQSRPLNSLLEEDLDFERAGKPVPVITEEVSEDIEALIKRRIIALDFDEVVRRRPNDAIDGAARRGRLDNSAPLSDAKPQKSLADEYAEDHLRATDPEYTDTRTATLRAAHKSIEAHWASVSAQLDALCNWHYKPKPPAPSLEVRVDAPTISMEDARPTAAEGEMGGEGMLAPQEVWNKGMDAKREGEVVTKGGGVVAREEETREQKLRRRRREKERIKKNGGNVGSAAAAGARENGGTKKKESKKDDEANIVGQLKKGGVKVIDKKGALRDVEGKAVGDENGARHGAGKFKL